MSPSARVGNLRHGSSLLGSAAARSVLTGQAWLARNRCSSPSTEAPITDGTVWTAGGVSHRGRLLDLALLGDGTAAGLGADPPGTIVAAQLAMRLSAATRRPIRLHNRAWPGACTGDLRDQYRALDINTPPDLAIILVGANDITEQVPIAESTRQLSLVMYQLRMDDVAVVVATRPDLGSVRPIAESRRPEVQRVGRALARAQAETTRRAGGVPVSLGGALAADVVVPSALDALKRQPAVRRARPASRRTQPRRHLVAA